MSDVTGISWSDSTFNPWMGCTKVSPACDHCYAERDTKRFGRVEWGAGKPRVRTNAENWHAPKKWDDRAGMFNECLHCGYRGYGKSKRELWTCDRCDRNECKPARRRVFCASLADVFDNEVDPAWRADLFALIEKTPNLDWLVLTKRVGNVERMMREVASHLFLVDHLDAAWLPPNVWLGATVVNQEEADRDIPKLLAVPARVRFLSIEPMLGPVNVLNWLTPYAHNGAFLRDDYELPPAFLNWVICGGESGPQARLMREDWIIGLRDQCIGAGVPFHFKQWGEWLPYDDDHDGLPDSKLIYEDGHPYDSTVRRPVPVYVRVGKRASGRKLDGVEHNQFPQ